MGFTQLTDPESTARFRHVADSLPVLVWISGVDKLCTWFNRSWLDFVGRTMEQELGNGWAENVYADDFDRCLDIYVSSFDARVPFRMEYRLRHNSGEYRWILDEGIPLYNESREFVGYLGCCLDITEQKLTATELRTRLERERRITQNLQSAFLPPFLPEITGLELQACYRPAEAESQLGGDWYDAFILRDGRIALSIGDVFGHGLEAAGAMVRLRETLRAVTGFIDEDPAVILQLADRAFQKSHANVVASAIFAIYEPSTRCLRIANAGHPQPALVHDEIATLIGENGILLGVEPLSTFSASEHMLDPGDSFIMYTDGLVEMERDIDAGERQLLRALEQGPLVMEDIVQRLTANNRHDDVAALALTLSPQSVTAADRSKSAQTKSARHAREALLQHFREGGLPDRALEMAVGFR